MRKIILWLTPRSTQTQFSMFPPGFSPRVFNAGPGGKPAGILKGKPGKILKICVCARFLCNLNTFQDEYSNIGAICRENEKVMSNTYFEKHLKSYYRAVQDVLSEFIYRKKSPLGLVTSRNFQSGTLESTNWHDRINNFSSFHNYSHAIKSNLIE